MINLKNTKLIAIALLLASLLAPSQVSASELRGHARTYVPLAPSSMPYRGASVESDRETTEGNSDENRPSSLTLKNAGAVGVIGLIACLVSCKLGKAFGNLMPRYEEARLNDSKIEDRGIWKRAVLDVIPFTMRVICNGATGAGAGALIAYLGNLKLDEMAMPIIVGVGAAVNIVIGELAYYRAYVQTHINMHKNKTA